MNGYCYGLREVWKQELLALRLKSVERGAGQIGSFDGW
jgi:hypothetical protein